MRHGKPNASAENGGHRQLEVREGEGRRTVPGAEGPHLLVAGRTGVAVDLDARFPETDEPSLGNPGLRVERELHVAVVVGARVGHLDEEEDVGRLRMEAAVIVLAEAKDRDVGLGLRGIVKDNRILKPR